MSEHTDIRVAYTDDILYVRGSLGDREPSGIRANSLYRDRLSGDDVFGVLIDAGNDKENALLFWTTPSGVRGDAAILGDGRSTNEAWNGFWDVDVSRNHLGWTAEIRIPFATLGVPVDSDTITIGLTVYRYIARKNELHTFPAISPEWDHLRPSRARRLLVTGVGAARPLYVTPYLLAGVAREIPAPTGTSRRNIAREAGVDLQYRVTSALTLDLTVNTDFAQAEADDQQINLTRFPLFLPERRRFFQERSGLFEFATGGDDLLFYSRRIGVHDGRGVPVLGGVRLAGKLGDWDVGLLEMQTGRQDQAVPENFGVLRLRRPIRGGRSHVGSMLTSRIGADGAQNIAAGIDADVRLFGDDYLIVRAAQTADRPAAAADLSGGWHSGTRRLTWERRRAAGARYIATAGWTGSDYVPRSGFVARTGVTDATAAFAYGYFDGDGPLSKVDPFQVAGAVLIRHDDGRVESALLEYNLDLEWRSGVEVGADVALSYEHAAQGFGLPADTRVEPGEYRFTTLDLGVQSAPGAILRAGIDLSVGTFYDGHRLGLEGELLWSALRQLELSTGYAFDTVRFRDRSQGFDSHVIRVRAGLAANTQASATINVQYASLPGRFAGNLRLRYNFAEGHDFWIVYDGGRELGEATERQALLVKYTRTFTW